MDSGRLYSRYKSDSHVALTRFFILAGAVSAVGLVLACAPDPGPFFRIMRNPDNPSAFQKGHLGLVTPTLTKDYELIAFRSLNGLSWQLPPKDPDTEVFATEPDARQQWRDARSSVAGQDPQRFIRTDRVSGSGTDFVYYPNCLDDAFVTAARTLKDRKQRYPSKQAVLDWIAAQDQVFDQCGGDNKKPLPFPAPLSSSALLVRADRDYQIAAAHFYAQDLGEAGNRFRAIAADSNSPWQEVGEYMVARTLLRDYSLNHNAAAGVSARQQLAKVVADARAPGLQSSARGLLEHLNAIDNPGALMQTLSGELTQPEITPAALTRALHESAYVAEAPSFQKAISDSNHLPDAFDWVHTIETANAAHALDRWKANHSELWLTAALMHASGKDAAAASLIAAARDVTPQSPAFGTVRYNAIRLRIERGEAKGPRAELERLLSNHDQSSDGLENAWRAERMRLAVSFDDMLRWAPRRPLYASETVGRTSTEPMVLDGDSVDLLNSKTPLAKLVTAAQSRQLPAWISQDIALATWTRAFVLGQDDLAKAVAPVIAAAHPAWQPNLAPEDTSALKEWRFRAALMIERNVQFNPRVTIDYKRKFSSGDWWCGGRAQSGQSDAGDVAWRLPTSFQTKRGRALRARAGLSKCGERAAKQDRCRASIPRADCLRVGTSASRRSAGTRSAVSSGAHRPLRLCAKRPAEWRHFKAGV